ncbi:hypothetical protein N865_04960 [Intrasporangium oryzae NRRL B-24470]|uniref:Carboxypeptidase regulatory-like domain-containing protein n=1 Tax=Intrasporangium oryzae NRRL B-24470 TaxID=1386089 RepID=W9GCJ2_9MICO|nr:carboxypeptidase regulatory-like domain-containing protein [Intrasporangium oryzae]EWT02513.1 hypothetical protein N865_04960 [Intrasporangium oryzae NRRL B-24470]
MSSHKDVIDDKDLANLAQVRALYAHADPVPVDLTERIKFALTVQALHAEVAELMDSAMLATRGPSAPVEPMPTESVTFSAASVSLMVTANESDIEGRVRVDGWVTAPGASIEAVTSEGSTSVISDANGRFVMDDLPHGPIHFVIMVEPGDETTRPVITPTIQV